MRFSHGGFWVCTLVLLSWFGVAVNAWSKEDYEIFRLNDEVQTHEGKTFYEFIGVDQHASRDQINSAYRKTSLKLHPDRVEASYRVTGGSKSGEKKKKPTKSEIQKYRKTAEERYSRLSVVVNILRGPERERYDYFLKNGFPAWRGTGYFYNRFRPGAGTVVTGLFIFGGGLAHFGVLYLNWHYSHESLVETISYARDKATNKAFEKEVFKIPETPTITQETTQAELEDVPAQVLNRKQRRLQERQERSDAKAKPSKKSKASKKAAPKGDSPESDADSAKDESGADPERIQPVGTRYRVVGRDRRSYIVDSEKNVFLEEVDRKGKLQLYYLDGDMLLAPTYKDTAAYRIPMFFYKQTIGRFAPAPSSNASVKAG